MFPLTTYKLLFTNGRSIKQICIGSEHCLILDDSGSIYSVGDNTYGELGLPNSKLLDSPSKISFFNQMSDKVAKIAVGLRNSFVLLSTGDLYVFGDNSEGQSTGYETRYLEPTLLSLELESKEKISDIFVGDNHVIIKGTNSNLYSWGSSEEGKLCFNENKQYIEFPKLIQSMKSKSTNFIFAGKNITIISTSSI
jgi:alpha-tubulin suppressor-like RCC1 family protein